VDETDSSSFKISFGQWGNWLWENASPQVIDRTGIYDVKRSEDNLSYELLLLDIPEDMVFIYPVGMKWVELDVGR
jgi:hypothetical protein